MRKLIGLGRFFTIPTERVPSALQPDEVKVEFHVRASKVQRMRFGRFINQIAREAGLPTMSKRAMRRHASRGARG